MKPILDFSKEVYQWEMRKYPGLNDQTIISIPRSGLVQNGIGNYIILVSQWRTINLFCPTLGESNLY